MARAVITSFPWSRRWWRWISWNSMAKQSVEVASSCSVRRSGEGLPCSRHQRKTSSPAPSSRGEISLSTQRMLMSEKAAWWSPVAAEPYRTRETRRSPQAFGGFNSCSVSSLSIRCLPIAGGPAAARIAAAESAESAIAGIGAAESAGPAAAPGSARHHVTQEQAGQETAAPAPAVAARSAGAEQEEQHGDAAEDHRPGKRLGGRFVNAARKLRGEGDVFRLGDGCADGLRGRHQGFAVVLLAQSGAHLAQHGARKTVRNDGFQIGRAHV